MSAKRISNPVYLDEVTRFSDDRVELSPMEIMRRLRAQEWATRSLIEDTTVNLGRGRKRKAGTWFWAYVAFVASGYSMSSPGGPRASTRRSGRKRGSSSAARRRPAG